SQLDTETGRCVAPSEISCGPGTTLLANVCVPSCEGAFEVSNPQRTGCERAARIQFVHASPDPTLLTVDFYVDGRLAESDGTTLGDDLRYRSATPAIKVAEGSRLRVAVGTSSDDSEFLAQVPENELLPETAYLVVLRGVVASGFNEAVNDTSLVLDAIEGVLEEPELGPEVAMYHAVLDAATLDVDQRGPPNDYRTQPLVRGQPYGRLGLYDQVSASAAFDVLVAGDAVRSFTTSIGSFDPPLAPSSDTSAVIVFMGVVDPTQNRGPSGTLSRTLDAIWVDPIRGGGTLDEAARGQILHAATLGASEVSSVIAAGAGLSNPLTGSFDFAGASARVGLIPGVLQTLGIVANATNLTSTTLTPSVGESVRFLLIGDSARVDALAPRLLLVSDPTDALDRDPNTLTLQFVHAAVDAADRFDVHVSPAGSVSLSSAEFPDVGYGEVALETRSAPREASTLSLTLVGSTSVALAQFDVDFSSTGVASSGATLVLTGDATQPTTLELLVFAEAANALRVNGMAP
ncbi:MAG: hypothetical protein AAF658_13735, partial [Myxococcota bacterium]